MTPTGTSANGVSNSGMPTLGRYTLVREIARSNDIVWEGIDPKMNRRVAVKELNLPPTLTGQPRRDRIERFFREARAAGAMNHPNIVTIHEVGEDRGRYFISMEYLEGHTLRERLQLVGSLSVREAVNIASALCDALGFAHSRGVVHRDIKPENVYLLTDGRVKLTDFGIARITHEAQLTVAGQVFGTPSYMSPEQVLGKEIDFRSDIFSLGVLLYEMVTGRRPFTADGDSVVTITYRIMNDPIPPAVGISPVLNNVIQRATAKLPAGRFQTATEFGTMLLAAGQTSTDGATFNPAYERTEMYGQPNQSPAAPLLTSPDAWARQQPPAPTGTAGGGAPSLTQPAPVLNANLPPAVSAPDLPAQSSNNGRIGAVIALVIAMISVISLGWFWGSKAFSNFQNHGISSELEANNKKASELYLAHRYEEAAALFQKTRLSPNVDAVSAKKAAQGEVFSYRMLGQQAQDRNDLVAAQHWFQEAIKVAPDDQQAKAELEGVQKKLQAVGGTTAVVQPEPSVNKVAIAPPPATLSSETPLPGSVSTNDFVDANARAANQAATLLQQGTEAYRKGDATSALRVWRTAVEAGPGSPAAVQAQEMVNRVLQGKDPFADVQ